MRRSVVTFCVLVALVIIALATNVAARSDKDLCAYRWPNDEATRKICDKRQDEGAERADRYIKRHHIDREAVAVAAGKMRSGPYLKLFNHCVELWRVANFNTLDFEMFARCLYKEGDAHNPRRGIGGTGIRPRPRGDPAGDRLEDKLSPFE